ncbi:MAG TPA: VCBS repeat-containing protein [Kofleriaceae bacterium]
MVLTAAGQASAQKWQDSTATCLGTTAQWTNKVEVADVDGDGKVDLLLANGGNYSAPGTAEATRVFKNTWGEASNCTEISAQALAGFTGLSRMIKAADIDGDGDVEILTGGAYGTQLKLFKREGTTWSDATAQLPQQLTSIGDAEFGDVDNDGDLDIVLADWGGTNPGTNAGGRTRLYLNNAGTFTEVTSTQMPDTLVKWSWDLELADVDNDWDLDILVSCKLCTTSYLFRNDGHGRFTDDPNALPHFSNNYEFEPMDIDKDGDLDLVTINDGPNVTEHIFVNKGDGTFADETSTRLTGTANPAGADDNVAVWLDYDADGDPDLLIGTLGTDRLLANDGTGKFTLVASATPNDTNATLGLVAADFDGDGRLDLLQGQGEIQSSLADKVQVASTAIAVDTVAPTVRVASAASVVNGVLYASVNDLVGPSHPHDFQKVIVTGGAEMKWMGGMLWRAEVTTAASYEVCATDRQGNKGCATSAAGGNDAGVTPDAPGPGGGGGGGGGCCEASGDQRGALALIAIVAFTWRRRRPRGGRRTSRAA